MVRVGGFVCSVKQKIVIAFSNERGIYLLDRILNDVVT